MLIRSQNRDYLTNLRQVSDLMIGIDHKTKKYRILVIYPHSLGDDYANMSIGEYSTKEKAITVLDEIQNQYQYMMECKYFGIGKEQPEFIFSMPQDEMANEILNREEFIEFLRNTKMVIEKDMKYKCPKCGEMMEHIDGDVLLCCPARYFDKFKCQKCGFQEELEYKKNK